MVEPAAAEPAAWTVPGAPADAVVYAEDPRSDLDQLAHPIAVVLRGRPVRVNRIR